MRGGARASRRPASSRTIGVVGAAANAGDATRPRRAAAASASPMRSAARSRSRARRRTSRARTGSCSSKPGTNVGASTACHANVPVCSESSSTSWSANASGGSSANAHAGSERDGRPRAASIAATTSETRTHALAAASTSGSRVKYAVPGREHVQHAHVRLRIRDPVRERMRELRAAEHQRYGDEPGGAPSHRRERYLPRSRLTSRASSGFADGVRWRATVPQPLALRADRRVHLLAVRLLLGHRSA